jgi:outer membrane protein assembly factor BamD (BamD/ComL family)
MQVSFKNKIILFFLVLTNLSIFSKVEVAKTIPDTKKVTEVKKDEKINKNFDAMTFEELEHNKKIVKTENDLDSVVRYIDRMIKICKNRPEEINKLPELNLDRADALFELEFFTKSAPAYKKFVEYYPGHEKAEYAAYKEVLSWNKQMLSSDHDQTNTKETLKVAKIFLKNPNYQTYKAKVVDIVSNANKTLLESELNCYNFHLDRKEFKAAECRLKYIKKTFFKGSEDSELVKELNEQLKAPKEKRKFSPKYLEQDHWWTNLFGASKSDKKKNYGKMF